MKELSEHGISLPPNMQGLADEQIEDLKLVDEWAEKCQPSGGTVECTDDCGRRNGKGKYYKKIRAAWIQKILKPTKGTIGGSQWPSLLPSPTNQQFLVSQCYLKFQKLLQYYPLFL